MLSAARRELGIFPGGVPLSNPYIGRLLWSVVDIIYQADQTFDGQIPAGPLILKTAAGFNDREITEDQRMLPILSTLRRHDPDFFLNADPGTRDSFLQVDRGRAYFLTAAYLVATTLPSWELISGQFIALAHAGVSPNGLAELIKPPEYTPQENLWGTYLIPFNDGNRRFSAVAADKFPLQAAKKPYSHGQPVHPNAEKPSDYGETPLKVLLGGRGADPKYESGNEITPHLR